MTNGIDGNDETCSVCSPARQSTPTVAARCSTTAATSRSTTSRSTDNSRARTRLAVPISNGFGTLTMTDVSFTNDRGRRRRAVRPGGTSTASASRSRTTATARFDGGAAYLLGGTVSSRTRRSSATDGPRRSAAGSRTPAATLTLVNDTFSGNIRGAIQTDQGADDDRREHDHRRRLRRRQRLRVPAVGKVDRRVHRRASRPAITNDDGNNFDQDGHCGFDGNGDIANADPHLASIADNGGPTRTQALLAGSQAIGNGQSELECPATDQRDITRDGPCDIGAFKTHPTSVPATPTTSEAGNITDSSADLHGHDQPLGRRRWIPLRLGPVAGRPAQLDVRPGRRRRRQRHVRDPDARWPESRDAVLLQDRRRQLVRLHAGHGVETSRASRRRPTRRPCSTSTQTRSPTRPPTSRSRSTRTAPTPATSSSTATAIRATIRPPIPSTSVPTRATSSSRPPCRTSIPTARTTSR